MVDLSTINPFRQGQSALTDGRQPFAQGNNRNTQALENGLRRVNDPVSLSDDANATARDAVPLGTSDSNAISAKPLGSAELMDKVLDKSLELIRNSLTDMFKLSGLDNDDAAAATDALFDDIKDMAASGDTLDYSFQQAIASHSRTSVSYAGANGAAAGVSESAMMAVSSLNISINDNTGEFSFSYEAAKVEVVKTSAIAIGNSAGAALGALGTVLGGLESGNNLVNALGNPGSSGTGGLLFDMNNSGVADFIRDLLEATTGSAKGADGSDKSKDGASGNAGGQDATSSAALAAERLAKLNQQLLEQASLIVRDVQPLGDEDGKTGNAGGRKLTVDLLMPLGRFGQDDKGATFTFPDSETVQLAAPAEKDVRA